MVDPFDHEIELKKGKLYDIPYKIFQISEVITLILFFRIKLLHR